MELIYKNNPITVKTDKQGARWLLDYAGKKVDAVVKPFGPHAATVSIGTSKCLAYFADDDRHIFVNAGGESFVFEKAGAGDTAAYPAASNDSEQIVRAPMPGVVVGVMTSLNALVSEGDPLLILEAMKMETTIYATISGVVTALAAKPSEQVGSDQVLMKIEKQD